MQVHTVDRDDGEQVRRARESVSTGGGGGVGGKAVARAAARALPG